MYKQSRRHFLMTAGALAASGCATGNVGRAAKRPNVVLIITDDQGYGDMSAHGNPHLKTPNLDRLRGEGVRFERFYVCPVCAPTRAALMTGRYNYRTRAIDTYIGRAMMDPEEVTLARMLSDAGYDTGIFGKWHLGDNYPMRAADKGFQQSLVHRGGGLVQPSDWPGNSYFSPTLSRNGEDWKSHGYCTDVFTEAAVDFINQPRRHPFFCYLPMNAPHTPLQVPDEWAKPYREMGLTENVANVYGMIANIDWNVGRILDRLDALGIAQDTLVVFMTDNGPQGFGKEGVRYNAGMRGAKGTLYEGGIRVPCFWRWPGMLGEGEVVETMAAHIDVVPTLLDICGASAPRGVKLDGRNLRPLLTRQNVPWPERCYFTQWHRGNKPERYRACAVVSQKYKLVDGKELYDLENDPQEKNDIAAALPAVTAQMRAAYDRWFDDVSATRGYEAPRIFIGTPHENPVVLTRQEWRGDGEGWVPKNAHWQLYIASEGPYDITLSLEPREAPGEASAGLTLGDLALSMTVPEGVNECTFKNVRPKKGNARLDTWVKTEGHEAKPWQVTVKTLIGRT